MPPTDHPSTPDPHLPLAITSLICGILSFLTCVLFTPIPILAAVVGLITGTIARRRYTRHNIESAGSRIAFAGQFLSDTGLFIGLACIAYMILNPPPGQA